jgi:hypothetical protein
LVFELKHMIIEPSAWEPWFMCEAHQSVFDIAGMKRKLIETIAQAVNAPSTADPDTMADVARICGTVIFTGSNRIGLSSSMAE